MRKFQKVTACIMAAALAATGCSGAGGTKAPEEPARTEAAGTQAGSGTQADSGTQASDSGGEEPVLVVYTARSEALNNAVIPEFEKDTGIKVEVVVAGTGELLKRAQSEKDNPLGDIFWVADQTMLSSSKDLFMEYVSPEDSNMLEAFRNNTGYFTPAFADPTVMIVNKDLKGDMKIDGFEDLLNPELKGKIAFGDPVNSSSAFQSLLAMLYGMGKDGDPLSDQAWDYVDQFIANLDGKMCNSSSQVYKGVAEGEYVVGLTWEDPAANYVKEGAAVEVVFPKEGAIFPGESVQILKGCKHPENAKKFVDYMLSEKIQNAVGSNLTVRPLRKDATLADYMTPQSEIKLFDNYDEGWVAEHKVEITNLFSEHMETSMD
ncbi:ABC transporter substrate-binding protein [Lachnoclostridium pacaense]|uniref:ABC transporter substrate-binding protein n=1 Tax=Enterocloster hominis (ex Hitch et al. 2024) TaxID=1917870 RepID=UPI001D115B4B|nr:ABC transporter substrate-binding protein [Lachnoclostridium pacaense]MCC2876477.1 ABC transporter substrate-binding protein [Lachnoclostridium pacaense]